MIERKLKKRPEKIMKRFTEHILSRAKDIWNLQPAYEELSKTQRQGKVFEHCQ
jgi:hypothetical protein